MTLEEYWAFVDRHRPRDNDAGKHCAALGKALRKLPVADVLDYDRINGDLVTRACRADLLSAACLVNGTAPDDSFEYFLWWLVMQGRDVYELAVADPESLIEITADSDDELEDGSYGYLAMHAYDELTGLEYPPADQPRRPRPQPRGRWVRSVSGVRRKWPTLWRLLTRPPKIDPAWLTANTGTAAAVTRAVHDNRRWGDLPVLADALEEGGCGDTFLLGHLRAGKPHARHCWATRLLLRAGA